MSTIPAVQANASGSVINVPAATGPTLYTQTHIAGSPCLAGDTILAFANVLVNGGGGGFSAFTSGTPTLTDTLGNIYTLIFWIQATFEGGPGMGVWIANSVAAGTPTLSLQFVAQNGGIFSPLDDVPFIAQLGIAEYPMASPTVQDSTHDSGFGVAGASLSITDSTSGSVTVTVDPLVTGNDWTFALIDLLTAEGIDYLVVCGMAAPSGGSDPVLPPTVIPSKYGTFAREIDSVVPSSAPGNDSVCYLWDRSQFPALTPPTLACPDSAAPLGVPYSSAFVASGGVPPYSDYSVIAGSLATGLTLDSPTGDVTGTPTVIGVYPFTGQVTDRYGSMGSTDCEMEVDALGLACHYGQIDVPFTDQLVVTGGIAPFTWAVIAGSLPPGLTLNPSTGLISGTPTVLGLSSVTFQVTDSFGLTATAACSVLIGTGPSPVSGDLCIYAGAVGH